MNPFWKGHAVIMRRIIFGFFLVPHILGAIYGVYGLCLWPGQRAIYYGTLYGKIFWSWETLIMCLVLLVSPVLWLSAVRSPRLWNACAYIFSASVLTSQFAFWKWMMPASFGNLFLTFILPAVPLAGLAGLVWTRCRFIQANRNWRAATGLLLCGFLALTTLLVVYHRGKIGSEQIVALHADHAWKSLSNREYEQAIKEASRLLDIDPSAMQGLIIRGSAELALGDIQSALADFERLVENDPHSPSGFYYRGFARYKAGDMQGALSDLGKAADSTEDASVAREARRLLNDINDPTTSSREND